MIHPDTGLRFIGEEIGYGVFATSPIPMGTATWVRDRLDREFFPRELDEFDPVHRAVLDHFSYRTPCGNYLFCWDHARFMNHSFRPTCLLTPHGLEIAVRDIAAGEELTIDYGCLNIIEPFTPRDEGQRRKQVLPDDLLRCADGWDGMIAAALESFCRVRQPLDELIDPAKLRQIRAVCDGTGRAVSIKGLYCGPRSGSVDPR